MTRGRSFKTCAHRNQSVCPNNMTLDAYMNALIAQANDGCVNLSKDNDMHCGACNNKCTGGAKCRNGKCVCPKGKASCGHNAEVHLYRWT